MIRCRLLGHRRWWYGDPEPGSVDLILGCIRCKNPDLERDRVRTVDKGNGIVAVDRDGLQRLGGFLQAQR